jgi:hypothetical protein
MALDKDWGVGDRRRSWFEVNPTELANRLQPRLKPPTYTI